MADDHTTLALRQKADLDLYLRLARIFKPWAMSEIDRLYPAQGGFAKFVHYTSAVAALQIIKHKRLWLRSTTCMSDYREVRHGYELLREVFSDAAVKDTLTIALDGCSSGLASESFSWFDKWWPEIASHTYIASLSEHDTDHENHLGRLSMWRASVSKGPRVAVVLNIPWYSGGARALMIGFSPVAYFGKHGVRKELMLVIDKINQSRDLLRNTPRNILVGSVFDMLSAAVTSMKHEVFKEEREWRAIYSPKLQHSEFMQRSLEVIDGVPQAVYVAPLDSKVSPTLNGLDLSVLIDRVIIGPTQYPAVIRDALVEVMKTSGVPNPEARVVVSEIPIRT